MYFDIKPSIIDNMSLEGTNPWKGHLKLQSHSFVWYPLENTKRPPNGGLKGQYQ